MNNSNIFFKNILTTPINNFINEITDSVHLLNPIKNDFYKRNIKYSLKDYIIGIIDVLKNNTSWNSYNKIMNGNTLRKKHYEWIKYGSKSAFYNKIYKRRKGEAFKGIKISSLVTKGIPISISIDGGNKYDSFGIRYALFLRSKNKQSTPNASKANNYSKAVIISLEHHYFLKLLIIVLLIIVSLFKLFIK